MQQIAALRPATASWSRKRRAAVARCTIICPCSNEIRFHTCASGGLGHGLPAAVGVAWRGPTRKVIALLGDGSAMYSIQGLWTAAEFALPVAFIIVNNSSYRALEEFGRHFEYRRPSRRSGCRISISARSR